jgi:lipoprotein-releasing system permease protein
MFSRWTPFEWIVALRFLREGRLQTIFIILGVTIGVAVIVFMSALLAGLQSNFINRVLSSQSHIQLLPPREVARPLRGATDNAARSDASSVIEGAIVQAPLQRLKSIDQWQAIAGQIRDMPEVLVVSPMAGGSALVLRGNVSRSVSLNGIEPAQYFRIVDLNDKMVRGSARLSGTDILVGIELASDLGLDAGDKLRVSTVVGISNPLTVSGIFDLGNKAVNSRSVFMSLHTAQGLLGLPGGVTSLDVTVRDVNI